MARDNLLLIFLLLALLSCTRHPAGNTDDFASKLETANNIRRTNPDSALTLYDALILQSVSDENYHQKLAVLLEKARLAGKMGNPDSAVKILNLILRESAQTGDSSFVATASLQLGYHYLDRGNYSLAKVYYSKIVTTKAVNPLVKARALNGIGSASANSGNYTEAVEKYHEAMEIFLEHGDTTNATVQLQNLAIVHSENGKYELASQFNQRAIAAFELQKDSAKLAECFINQAIYNKNLKKEPVVDYYDRATHIFSALGDSGSILKINYNKAVYLISRKPAEAMILLDNVLDFSRQHQIKQGEVMALNALSDLYSKKEPERATHFAALANETAQKNGLTSLEFKTLKTLSLRLAEQGLHDRAVEYLFRLNELRDSLNFDQDTRAAADLQEFYQVTNLEQKNLLLTQENAQRQQQFTAARNFGILMSVFAVIVSILLIVVYRFYVSRKLAYNALFEIYRTQKPETTFLTDQVVTNVSARKPEQISNSTNFENISQKMNELLIAEKIYRDKYLTSENLAEKLGVSRRELSTYLQKVHNQNFATFINQHRVNYARNLIESATPNLLKLDLLASEAGFNNRQTFYKTFLQITGVTPGQYHKGLKNL